MLHKSLLLCLLLLTPQIQAANKFWVYLPTWANPTMTAADLKFPDSVQITYIHFAAHASTTSPYFSPVTTPADSIELARHFIPFRDTIAAHIGARFFLSVTAQDDIFGNIVSNVTNRGIFLHSVVLYLIRKGYHGVDWDWEKNLGTAANTTAFFRAAKDTLDKYGLSQINAGYTDPWIYYPFFNVSYNPDSMNVLLEAYLLMNYVMAHQNERWWTPAGQISSQYATECLGPLHRALLDCPYSYPTTAWPDGSCTPSHADSGYYGQDFTHNGISKWINNHGASRSKIGIGLWNGASYYPGSTGSTTLGGSISSTYQGYYSINTVNAAPSGNKHYVTESDCYWGNINGTFTSWIDSAGAYKRTKWAKDTMLTNNFMLYDLYSGFISTGQRYGRQPHFDAMVNAINGFSPVVSVPPTVTTTTATPVTNITAVSGGTIVSNGGVALSVSGVCWAITSVNPNPTVNDFKTVNGGLTGSWASTMTGLTPGVQYSYRAWGQNISGVGYGAVLTITTTANPTITNTNINVVSGTNATGTANATNAGGNGATIVDKGFVWATHSLPTLADFHNSSNVPTGTGTSSTSITGLTPGTSYFGRGYGTNNLGQTGYASSVLPFNTPGPPSIRIDSVTAITATSVRVLCTFSANGSLTTDSLLIGESASSYSIRVAGSPASTSSNNVKGTFVLTGLTNSCKILGKRFYVRPKADNVVGSVQGTEFTFDLIPAISPSDSLIGAIWEDVQYIKNKLAYIDSTAIRDQYGASSIMINNTGTIIALANMFNQKLDSLMRKP